MLLKKVYRGYQTRDVAVFLLDCREDEEIQADFPSKEASSPILETMASFTDGTILNEG